MTTTTPETLFGNISDEELIGMELPQVIPGNWVSAACRFALHTAQVQAKRRLGLLPVKEGKDNAPTVANSEVSPRKAKVLL